MKAKVKGTGEIVDVVWDYADWYCPERNTNYEKDELEFPIDPSYIDWEQRRYEIARDMLPRLMMMREEEEIDTLEECANMAVLYADALIVRLMKKDE